MKGFMTLSFIDAGGLMLGFFLFYVLAFGVAWYCGYQKRDQLRREAVEIAVARENALQAMVTLDWNSKYKGYATTDKDKMINHKIYFYIIVYS